MKFGIFTYIDLFRIPILLYFRGYTKRASGLGILFSLGIYIFLIYSFVHSDFLSKKSPIVVTQTIQNEHAKRIDFNDRVLLIVALQDSAGRRYIDDTIFNIKFKYSVSPTSASFKTLSPCTLKDVSFNESLFQQLQMDNAFCLQNKSFYLEGSWDEPNVQYVTLNIYPCYNSSNQKTCKSNQEIFDFFHNPTLSKFFAATYHHVQIDLEDYENPFKTIYKKDYQVVDTSLRKRVSFFLQTLNVVTDDGIINPSTFSKSDFMLHSKEFDLQIRVNNTEPFIHFFFYSIRDEVIYKRRYQKLPEILGSITGMVSFIMVGCMLVSHLTTYVSTMELVLNHLYIFPEIINHKKKRQKILKNMKVDSKPSNLNTQTLASVKKRSFSSELRNSASHLAGKSNQNKIFLTPRTEIKNTNIFNSNKEYLSQKQLKTDSFFLEHYSEEREKKSEELHTMYDNKVLTSISKSDKKNSESLQNKDKQKLSRLKSLIKKSSTTFFENIIPPDGNKNKLKLSISGYLKYVFKKFFCMKKSPKQKLILMAEKKFRQDMDIVSIITKLHDLERLKIILLNEDQLVLFNYLSKPLITVDAIEKYHNSDLNPSHMKMSKLMNTCQKSAVDIEESYKRINTSVDNDKINIRLMELFDERVCSWRKN